MSDTDNDKPKLGARPPLGLKRTVETGKVKQSFSHGRSNTVVVEVKRRRAVGRPGEEQGAPAPEPEVQAKAAPAPAERRPTPPPPAPRRPGDSLLSRQEMQAKLLREAEEARMSALEEARRREDAERQAASEEERRRAEENRKAEEEAAQHAAEVAKAAEAAPQPAPEPEAKAAPSAPARAAQPAAPAAPAQPTAVTLDPSMPAPRRFTPVQRPDIPKRPEPDVSAGASTAAGGAARPASAAPTRPDSAPAKPGGARDRKTDDRRQSGKLTVNRALGGEDGARARSLAALKRAREKEKR